MTCTPDSAARATFPNCVPVLSDGWVLLRAHSPADAPGIVEQCADPTSIRWTTVPVPYGLDDARTWLAQIARDRPSDTASLARVHGVGAQKLADYGEDVLRLVRGS